MSEDERWCESEITCHPTTVAGPVMAAAKDRAVLVEVVESPGGEPKQIDLDVSAQVVIAVHYGQMTVPLRGQPALGVAAGLPWGSVATLRSNGEKLHRIVGPATRQKVQWALPVLFHFLDPTASLDKYLKEAPKLRRSWGSGASFGLTAANTSPPQPS